MRFSSFTFSFSSSFFPYTAFLDLLLLEHPFIAFMLPAMFLGFVVFYFLLVPLVGITGHKKSPAMFP